MFNEEDNVNEMEEENSREKLVIEEEKIDNQITDLRKSLDEINFEHEYYMKKLEAQLSDDNLSPKDRAFFEEQREIQKKLQKTLEERLSEAETMFKKAKNDLYDKEWDKVKEG